MKFFRALLFLLVSIFILIGIPALISGKGFLFSGNLAFADSVKQILVPAQSIFLAILIEAFPFVLIGAFLSSIIHELIPEELIVKWIPQNKLKSVFIGGLAGFILPVCDCGTIPVAKSLLEKGVPRSAVIAFTLAAPVVNPITLLATYFAFGLSLHAAVVRVAVTYLIACMVGLLVGSSKQHTIQSKARIEFAAASEMRIKKKVRIQSVIEHMVSELFGIVGFLICSAAVAAIYQVYHTQHAAFGEVHTGMISIIGLMVLAVLFSLCSQADAFVARSFAASYSPGAVLAFMLIGQMADIRNLSLLPKTFGSSVAIRVVALCFLFSFAAGVMYH